MKNFVQNGSTVEWTNSGTAVLSGAVVVVGNLLGIAATDIGAGETGTVQIEGCFTLPAKSAATINQGDSVDWDVSTGDLSNNISSPASGDNVGGAIAIEDKTAANTVVVKLLPGQGVTS